MTARCRLLPNMRRREKVLNWLAVLGALIGGAGLILLTIFDTKRHTKLHRVFLLVFMLGVAISAIFTIIEYRWLSKDFGEIRKLKKAYMAKALIAGILIILAIVFAVFLTQNGVRNSNIDGPSRALLYYSISVD
jgi:amino acid transporter